MRPVKAIAFLSVPFGAVSLFLLAGMCLTPYWDCRLDFAFEIWKPALLTLVVFTVVAALVLCVDLLLIKNLVKKSISYRVFVIGMVGAVVATLPQIFMSVGAQGLSALSPQVEFLPFAIAGAIFAVVLDRVVEPERKT